MKTRKRQITAIAVIAIVILSLAFIGCKSVTKPDVKPTPKPAPCKCDPKDHLLLGQSCDCGGENCDCSEIPKVTIGIEMVLIPAGTFTMGSDDRDDIGGIPAHLVTLTKSFYMGKYEVTQEQYQAVMGSNPSYFTSAVSGESGTPGKLPVERVNRYDAFVFCNKLSILEGLSPAYSISGKTNPAEWGAIPTDKYNTTWNAVVMISGANGYRLPTEAEWEYACRAGTTTANNTGNTVSDNTGWYIKNSGDKSHKVGLKTPNAWGLYDMHGNIEEMCWDWWEQYKSDAAPQIDPVGAKYKPWGAWVIRGGNFHDDVWAMRSAARANNPMDDKSEGKARNGGFRVARGLNFP